MLSAGATEFVPKAMRDFPPISSGGAKADCVAAERALKTTSSRGGLSKSWKVVAAPPQPPPPPPKQKIAAGHVLLSVTRSIETVLPTSLSPTLPVPPLTPTELPSARVPLFRLTASERAQEKWKERWMSIARVTAEKESQRNLVVEDSVTQEVGGWHTVFQLSSCEPVIADLSSEWNYGAQATVCKGGTIGQKFKEEGHEKDDNQNQNQEALLAAIIENDICAVQRLLRSNFAVSSVNAEHPLTLAACLDGREAVLQLLLENSHLKIDARDRRSKQTALLQASSLGRLQSCKLLVHHGASLSMQSRDGESILHKSVRSGNVQLVQWLCDLAEKKERGIKLNSRNKRRETPLLLTRSNSIARVLLQAGADADALDTNGFNIACIAARAGNAKLLETVLLHNKSGGTTERLATTTPCIQAAASGSVHCLRVILLADAIGDINALDEYGKTALHYASIHGHKDAVEMLLQETAASPTAEDNTGASAIVLAAVHGKRECLKALIKSDRLLKFPNSQGETVIESMLRVLSLSVAPDLEPEEKRLALVNQVLEKQNIILDLIEMGAPLTARCVKRLVPISPVLSSYDDDFIKKETTKKSSEISETRSSSLKRTGFFAEPLMYHDCENLHDIIQNDDGFDVHITFQVTQDSISNGNSEPYSGTVMPAVDNRKRSSESKKSWSCLAHKAVLSERCLKLKAMINFCENQMRENIMTEAVGSTSKTNMLELSFQGSDSNSFKAMIGFIYGSGDEENHEEARDQISELNDLVLLELLFMGDEFLLKNLVVMIERELLNRLKLEPQQVTNFSQHCLSAASALGCVSLKRAAAVSLLRSVSPETRGLMQMALEALCGVD